jgi:hypothetical protein
MLSRVISVIYLSLTPLLLASRKAFFTGSRPMVNASYRYISSYLN